jgi:hypothetical protein
MAFKILLTNAGISDFETTSTPFFNNAAWFQSIEKYTLLNNEHPKTVAIDLGETTPMYIPFIEKAVTRKLVSSIELHSLSNYYSPFFYFAGRKMGSLDKQFAEILQASHFFQQYDSITLCPLLGCEAENWASIFKQLGFYSYTYHHSTNWFHNCISNTEKYWSLRPSRLRNTIKRKRKKLESNGEFRIIIHTPSNAHSLKKPLDEYHKIYDDSWKKTEPFPAFINAIALNAANRNQLRLGIVYHNHKPAAAQIWIVCDNTAYIYKLAYRQSYSKSSIGSILSAELTDYVIEKDAINYIDFLTGNDSYKKDWMTSSQPLLGVIAYNPKTLNGKLKIILHVLAKYAKKLSK